MQENLITVLCDPRPVLHYPRSDQDCLRPRHGGQHQHHLLQQRQQVGHNL